MNTCPLCRKTFEGREACSSCGLFGGCRLICCPHCGYEFIASSTTVGWLKKVFGDPARAIPLSLAPVGPALVVVSTDGARRSLGRLTVLGILPGATVQLLQRRPSFLVRAGETEVALDRDVAAEILVEPTPL
jgi:DtxR family Mn-dependent transcriptional regulator/ferrous iron transport protein A